MHQCLACHSDLPFGADVADLAREGGGSGEIGGFDEGEANGETLVDVVALFVGERKDVAVATRASPSVVELLFLLENDLLF